MATTLDTLAHKNIQDTLAQPGLTLWHVAILIVSSQVVFDVNTFQANDYPALIFPNQTFVDPNTIQP